LSVKNEHGFTEAYSRPNSPSLLLAGEAFARNKHWSFEDLLGNLRQQYGKNSLLSAWLSWLIIHERPVKWLPPSPKCYQTKFLFNFLFVNCPTFTVEHFLMLSILAPPDSCPLPTLYSRLRISCIHYFAYMVVYSHAITLPEVTWL